MTSPAIKPITLEEGVKLRDFLSSFGRDRLNELLYSGRPENLSRAELLEHSDEAISKIASMHSGYDSAIDFFFSLAAPRKPASMDSGHADMT